MKGGDTMKNQPFYIDCHICGDIKSEKVFDENIKRMVCKDREACNKRYEEIVDSE